MLIDIHAKTSRSSDVKISANEVARRAAEVGFDGIAVCDRLSSAHAHEVLNACEQHGIKGFIGVEIPTENGVLLGFMPEVGEFYLSEEWRQITEISVPPSDIALKMFRDAGGAVIASRPYDLKIPHNMGDLLFKLGDIQGVEVFNSSVGQMQCDFALEAATFMNLPTAGGSDSADGDSLGRYGTYFEGTLETQADFVEALIAGDFWAVQVGPSPARKPRPRREDDRGGRGGRSGGRGGRDGGRGGRSGGRGGRDGGRGGRDGGRGGRDGGRGGRDGGRGGRDGGRGRDGGSRKRD